MSNNTYTLHPTLRQLNQLNFAAGQGQQNVKKLVTVTPSPPPSVDNVDCLAYNLIRKDRQTDYTEECQILLSLRLNRWILQAKVLKGQACPACLVTRSLMQPFSKVAYHHRSCHLLYFLWHVRLIFIYNLLLLLLLLLLIWWTNNMNIINGYYIQQLRCCYHPLQQVLAQALKDLWSQAPRTPQLRAERTKSAFMPSWQNNTLNYKLQQDKTNKTHLDEAFHTIHISHLRNSLRSHTKCT